VPTKPAREAKVELIKRMSVAEEVLRILHEWIISGKVNPGENLGASPTIGMLEYWNDGIMGFGEIGHWENYS